jgi:hypothetical protein
LDLATVGAAVGAVVGAVMTLINDAAAAAQASAFEYLG